VIFAGWAPVSTGELLMHAFIVRPFGIKNGIDFDKVDRELISPALDRLQMTGRTTQEITHAGNIRADMFHLLLTADIVVADISVHNANVFYELGVRHALRDRRTFLLRASIDEVPFDLKTDRYLTYLRDSPSASLDALVNGLAETRRNDSVDSPVYSMLPGLPAPDPSAFIVVPEDFREEVTRARLKREKGDLRFLASELTGLPWRREGMRVVGEAQFKIGDLKYAGETWEWVRAELPYDLKANLRLGTICQKLGDLVRSDEALNRVVTIKSIDSEDLAEARALLGSNAKTRWLAEWTAHTDPSTAQKEALRSPFLFTALEEYRRGFEVDPSHYYSGLNALAMVTILSELATAQEAVWRERFEDEDEAALRLKEYRNLKSQLTGAVEFSMRAQRQRLERKEQKDPWLALSFADYGFLLGKPNVRQLYRDALADLEPFADQVARKQMELFAKLACLPKSVDAVGTLFATLPEPSAAKQQPAKVLLFTGHRIDSPDRAKPRFPANREETAREAIRKTIKAEMGENPDAVIAIAGGASGGDLLFLSACEDIGIKIRRLYLIIPRDEYVKASVAPAGTKWVDRFNHQLETAAYRVYQQSESLPTWLQNKKDYDVWQRSNGWILHNALALGGTNATLIALWDGKGGDGPGGTQHMVESARERGARTVILDTNELFSL
jgi:hypothetical protein